MEDTRERRRCSECGAIFRIARDHEGYQQVDCMRCSGLTPDAVREHQRLRDPDCYERKPKPPRVFFLNERHEL